MSGPTIAGLPNLVIAGVTKAGTTSLFRYLGQHPDIGVADVKEVDHYAPMVQGQQPPPLADYAQHFAHCATARWRLEASPRYFIGGPPLVGRLAADLDHPKILITLREPVSRMWSSYTYKRSKNRLPGGMDFAAFLDACCRVADERLERFPEHAAYRTLATGVYADYLPDWFAGFGEDVRVLFFDDLVTSPAETLIGLCRWLGIDTGPVAGFDLAARNATYQPRSAALRRAAGRANATLSRIVADESGVLRLLRSSYHRVNTGRLDEQPADEDLERVRSFYEPTLSPLRRLLAGTGCAAVPGWLAEKAPTR